MRLHPPALLVLLCSSGLIACAPASGNDAHGFFQGVGQSSGDPAEDPGNGETGGTGGSAKGDSPTEPGAQGGSSSQAGGGADAAADAPAADAHPACSYPTGSIGSSVGNIVSSAIKWTGYQPGSSSPTTIASSAFFDCDGSAGIHAVLFVNGNSDCPVCQAEAQTLPAKMQTWGPAGVVVVYLLLDDANGGTPTAQTAKLWRSQFGLDKIYVAADPMFALQNALATAVPYEVLVDPRTMKIVDIEVGGIDESAVLALANQNRP